MYFQIDNTPEHIRRARKHVVTKEQSPPEATSQLVLAPFSRPPQVIFQDVPIGVSCERLLEIYNPTKQTQQLMLNKALPQGLSINLPEDTLILEPDDCYTITLVWTPVQPIALRETIRFTNDNRGRFDVVVVLKSIVLNTQSKKKKPVKASPGKIQKRTLKRSPTLIHTKKVYYKTTTVKKTLTTMKTKVPQAYNNKYDKENVPENINYTTEKPDINPFGSPVIDFDTDIFSNMRKTVSDNVFQQTYDKSPLSNSATKTVMHRNVLKPYNKQSDDSTSNIFDNISFTPLKCISNKNELSRGPRILISMHESENEDTENAEKVWFLTEHQKVQKDRLKDPISIDPNQDNLIPNTSSPKEQNGPNFSINTDFSRISDVSFLPPRCSTEKKIFLKMNDTHDIIDDSNLRCDTFTKESSFNFPSMNYNVNLDLLDSKPAQYNIGEKVCRQSLFKEYQQNKEYQLQKESYERNCFRANPQLDYWPHSLKPDVRLPARPITPPLLQCIPEESNPLSETQTLNKTGKHTDTFTINRTFDKTSEFIPKIQSTQNTWSKRDVRADSNLWKVPVSCAKKTKKAKPNSSISNINMTYDGNNSTIRNSSFYQPGNIYSQSLTVDPFLNTTYYYDEQAVKNFERDFKRWLNCILTPPADLESNDEQKIDVGKAWIENKNKEIPFAPTKEKVCSAYHNSHRLESLRKSARALLLNPEIVKVIQKLNAQIEKKLIAIRTDKNLHLDVGLQKMIMELLLSYNPLWLRIGLEAIYGIVIPLKSNNDIEGLTTFIIQRMFKNPLLKNKQSKSSAPNMLLPAYMEAIKKYTLKKFFQLVFFLDQAKQKKLIGHDPCLFRRNAPCKESREIVIRFTRELIAGIGDITKHLRPLGYVVTHKQTYLDEFKYGVDNIAVDIRDGIRLTKVMEIILMKKDFLKLLRTPAVSRLQKIHNVQVALNALKEANFVIVGEITATDIADGHREKTLSLLWQIIHVFRAPLFEKAAIVIQTWWKKKYQSILEKKYEKMKTAVVVVQKFCRMWLERKRFREIKQSVLKIWNWYIGVKKIKEAKNILEQLKIERKEMRDKAASLIQSHVRKLICMNRYRNLIRKTIIIQSVLRCYLERKKYLQLKNAVLYVQNMYRCKMTMKKEMRAFIEKKNSAIKIQSYYRMIKQKKMYIGLKKTVKIIEARYIALKEMRKTRNEFIKLKLFTIMVQAHYRGNKERKRYIEIKENTSKIQDWYRRAKLVRKAKHTLEVLKLEKYQLRHKSALTIQSQVRKWLCMRQYHCTLKKVIIIQSVVRKNVFRKRYLTLKNNVIRIQRLYRGKLLMRKEMENLNQKRNAAIKIQSYYRMVLQRRSYNRLKQAVKVLEDRYLAQIKMRKEKSYYNDLKNKVIKIQSVYRGKINRRNYIKVRTSALKIQDWYRRTKLLSQAKITLDKLKQEREVVRNRSAIKIQSHVRKWLCVRHYNIDVQRIKYVQSKIRGCLQRKRYLQLKKATLTVQTIYRGKLLMRKEMLKYNLKRQAVIMIQSYYKMLVQRRSYLKTKKAVLTVEERYKSLIEMRKLRSEYIETRHRIVKIQSIYRGKREQKKYNEIKMSVLRIQDWFRRIQLMKKAKIKLAALKSERNELLHRSAILIQSHIRKLLCLRKYRNTIKKIILIQSTVRCFLQRKKYVEIKQNIVVTQNIYRAKLAMRKTRDLYLKLRNSVIKIQSYYRMIKQRRQFGKIKQAVMVFENRYLALKQMREARNKFKTVVKSIIIIQSHFKGYNQRKYYLKQIGIIIKIQQKYRAILWMRKERMNYMKIRHSVLIIQMYFKGYMKMKNERALFMLLRSSAVRIQTNYRRYLAKKNFRLQLQKAIEIKKRENAAICIQKHYRRYLAESKYKQLRFQAMKMQEIWRGKLVTRLFRCEFLQKRRSIIKLQARLRGYLARQRLLAHKEQIRKEREQTLMVSAVTKIQAVYRGYLVRRSIDNKLVEISKRCREKMLNSHQQTLRERYDKLIYLLLNMYEIGNIILIFTELEYLTDIYPMLFNETARMTVTHIYSIMLTTNRSISSVKLLTYASAALVNLTRYHLTGPNIYNREHIEAMLKFMLRFSSSEPKLFCRMCTFIWTFSKYDHIRRDLEEYLKMPDNLKLLKTTKSNIDKAKKKPFTVPRYSMAPLKNYNRSVMCKNDSLPSLEPLFRGSVRKLAFFKDPSQAINCLFETFNLGT